MKSGKTLCIYCRERPAVEREHVVARQFFPPPRQNDLELPTVPSCSECNDEFQLHEDYLRTFLGANWEAISKNPAAKKLHDGKVLRSLKKTKALRQLLLKSVSRRHLFSHEGHYLGQVFEMSLDMKRAEIVCHKIVVGLLYHNFGLSLPPDYALQLWSNITDDLAIGLMRIMDEYKFITRRLGEGVFTYKAAQANEDHAQTIWLCSFYDTFYFAATSMPKAMLNSFQRQFGR